MRYPQTAALIKSARLRKKYSQEKAAQLVGTSRFHWIRWEQGLHRPLELGARVAEVLGITKESLDEADEPEVAPMVPLAADLSPDEYAVYGALTARIVARASAPQEQRATEGQTA